MKEKDFDQLIAAAFGELRADEFAQLESELDADGRAELAAYKQLQGTLNSVPTPGPCQVSPEMLRDRILSEGVRSRPLFFSWLPRIAATGIAAALGLFILNSLGDGSSSSTPAGKPAQVATATAPNHNTVLEAGPKFGPGLNSAELPRSDGDIVPPDESVRIVEAAPEPKAQPERTRSYAKSRVASKRATAPTKATAVVEPKAAITARGGAPGMTTPGASAETIGADAAMAAPVVSTVVIVTSEEGEVGAPVATEVSTSNDVGIKG